MDLQAAADGQDIGDDDSATAILRGDHQAMRKAFAQYRELMNDAAAPRAALAQDIRPLVHELVNAHEDIQECVDTLRDA